MPKSVVYSLVFLGMVFLNSCSKGAFYESSVSIPNKVWKQDHKATFSVMIDDTAARYDFTLVVRTTTDYQFNNMWLFMHSKTPDGQKAREPFEMKIADEKGNWLGNSTGTILENTLAFKRRKLPLPGKYVFTIEQGVTENNLKEVLDVTLIVTKIDA